jgi:hypothetical protein
LKNSYTTKEIELVEDGVNRWFEERSDTRSDIETAIYVFNFLDEIDMQGADVLTWGLKDELMRTKKQCLLIIASSIDVLV